MKRVDFCKVADRLKKAGCYVLAKVSIMLRAVSDKRIVRNGAEIGMTILISLRNRAILIIKYANKTPKRRFLILASLLILGIILVVFVFEHNNSQVTPVSNLIKINGIQSEITDVQNTVTATSRMTVEEKNTLDNKLENINAKIKNMMKDDKEVKLSKINNLAVTLASDKIDLSQKITALNSEVTQIKKKVFPKKSLNKQALPFDVISIDNWNGNPYAEISQKSNKAMITYIGLYQASSGWKVIDISSDEQTSTFANEAGQVVHIELKQF
jgi:hypothetical protein